MNPLFLKHYCFMQAGPIRRGVGNVWFRFVFNESGPHVDMNEGLTWVPLSDYTHYGLKPESVAYLTEEDVNDLITLFERSVNLLDPQAEFLRGPLSPTA